MFLSKLRPAFLSLAEYTIYGPCYSRPQTSISRWMLLKQQATVPCTLKLCHEPEQRLYFGPRVKLTWSGARRRLARSRLLRSRRGPTQGRRLHRRYQRAWLAGQEVSARRYAQLPRRLKSRVSWECRQPLARPH